MNNSSPSSVLCTTGSPEPRPGPVLSRSCPPGERAYILPSSQRPTSIPAWRALGQTRWSLWPSLVARPMGLACTGQQTRGGAEVSQDQPSQPWGRENPLLTLFYNLQKLHFLTLKKFFLIIYFQREEKGGRERHTHTHTHSVCERNTEWLPLARPQLGTWPTTQACAQTGTRTSDLSVCRPALNPLSHTSQGYIF